MKKNSQRLCLIFLTASMFMVISSCTPEDENTVKAEAVGNNENSVIKKDSEKNIEKHEDADASILSVISEPGGKDFLLYHETAQSAVYPEDFEIGPLQQQMDMDETESAINLLVSDFAASILANEPDGELIYSKRRSFVLRNLKDSLQSLELSAFRLGIINIDSVPAIADIRFIGDNSFFDGTIYFIREGNWKIYDLQFRGLDSGSDEEITNETWFPIYNNVR